MRFTFDANILCYAFDPKEEGRREQAQALLERARGADCVLTLQSLAEFYAVATRKFGVPRAVAHELVDEFRRCFPVEAADEDCLAAAMSVRDWHDVQFWDAMLWATARKAGCAILFSEDGHDGMHLGGITIANPFKDKNRELLDAALPPKD